MRKIIAIGVLAVIAKLDGRAVPKRIDTGVVLVSKENLDTPEIEALVK